MEIEERKKELRNVINRIDTILAGLENNESFNLLLDDFRANAKKADNAWAYLSEDDQKFRELRIMKLATMSIINVLDILKQDLKTNQIELAKLENPEVLINKDYDSQ